MDMVRFTEIEVELVGQDGNAFAILGRVKRELKRNGVSAEEQTEFYTEATEQSSPLLRPWRSSDLTTGGPSCFRCFNTGIS